MHTHSHIHTFTHTLLPLLTHGAHCLPIPTGSMISLCAPGVWEAGSVPISVPLGLWGRCLLQLGLLRAFPEGLEFKPSLKQGWGWGELGNLLGPQAGECNTLLCSKNTL